MYSLPETLERDAWGLAGVWTVGEKHISVNEPGGRIACRFQARDANLVMGPTQAGADRRFRMLVDGALPPSGDRGVDTDADGRGIVDESRLYPLVRQQGTMANRRLEIDSSIAASSCIRSPSVDNLIKGKIHGEATAPRSRGALDLEPTFGLDI